MPTCFRSRWWLRMKYEACQVAKLLDDRFELAEHEQAGAIDPVSSRQVVGEQLDVAGVQHRSLVEEADERWGLRGSRRLAELLVEPRLDGEEPPELDGGLVP